MFKHFVTTMITILYLTEMTPSLIAQVPSQNDSIDLEKALSKIPTNSLISAIRSDGNRIQGRLVSINYDQLILSMSSIENMNADLFTHRILEFERIQYRKSGELNTDLMLVGLMGGTILGGIIGSSIDHPRINKNVNDMGGVPIGLAIGASGGLLAGTIIPLAIPKT
jgi:hypothetical protein